MSPSFNLWDKPWIRVMHCDGQTVELGIGACLKQAHTLFALHDPSPLVVAGVHRLLTAVLQAIYAPESLDDIEGILTTGAFDTARLEAFAAQYHERFDLFHPTAPFLQTGDVPLEAGKDAGAMKSVVSLFNEVPGATNRAHFHHVTDDSHRVCPACCARGMLTIPSFASAGGSGMFPSINGVPPVYVLPTDDTVFQALALSLTAPEYQPSGVDPGRSEAALWNRDALIAKNVEIAAVGYLESLTFPARRMRLFPVQGGITCTHCGTVSDISVQTVLFEMGHRRGKNAPPWDDPFVAFVPPSSRTKRDTAGLLPVRPREGKSLWREYSSLLLTHQDNVERQPRIVRQLGRLVDRGVLDKVGNVRFRCIGIRTDSKGKFFEWLDEALVAPPRLLVDPDGTRLIEDALSHADEAETILTRTFEFHFRPERMVKEGKPAKQQVVRFKTLRARMQAMFWEQLAPAFRSLIDQAANPDQRDQAERDWGETVVRIGNDTFRTATDQAGERADALRARVEAQAECRRRLYAKRKEWFGDN